MNVCPKHPNGVREKTTGECWECLGRPPDWVCVTDGCNRPFPTCGHWENYPNASLSKPEAAARARVLTAVEALVNGPGSWSAVERAISEYGRAVRSTWAERLERARRN